MRLIPTPGHWARTIMLVYCTTAPGLLPTVPFPCPRRGRALLLGWVCPHDGDSRSDAHTTCTSQVIIPTSGPTCCGYSVVRLIPTPGHWARTIMLMYCTTAPGLLPTVPFPCPRRGCALLLGWVCPHDVDSRSDAHTTCTSQVIIPTSGPTCCGYSVVRLIPTPGHWARTIMLVYCTTAPGLLPTVPFPCPRRGRALLLG